MSKNDPLKIILALMIYFLSPFLIVIFITGEVIYELCFHRDRG